MKRIEYHQYGAPTHLRLADFTPQAPGQGEVLVQVAAAAANGLDWKIRQGQMRLLTGRRFPRGVGQDVSGTIIQVGPGVEHLRVGDAVFGATWPGSGSFAEAVVVKSKHLARKPDALSFEQAAALPVVGVTALQVLRTAKIGAGHRVFVNGALGGVGQLATQLAHARGATVSGSVRDPHAPQAIALGLDPVVGFDVDPHLFEHEFDLVFDTVGTLPRQTSLAMVKRHGSVVDIVPAPVKFLRYLRHRQYRLHLGNANTSDLEALARACTDGALKVSIARTVSLEDAIAALTELEERGTPKGGKLLVVPSLRPAETRSGTTNGSHA